MPIGIGKVILGVIGNPHNKKDSHFKVFIKCALSVLFEMVQAKNMMLAKTLAKEADDKEIPAIVITRCHCRLRVKHTIAVE